ncbi:MAG: hypothetical protein Q8842_03270 [Candidatus Phytoplasma australasiaticum]|nr:hypothetical protein [Candidatus Phytoplasma australasiaticum]
MGSLEGIFYEGSDAVLKDIDLDSELSGIFIKGILEIFFDIGKKNIIK